jgi:hypothetical protein
MTAVDEIAGDLGATVDQLGRYGDLDQARAVLDGPPGPLEALWQKVNELAEHRKVQPQLRCDILRVAEKVDPDLVAPIKKELDEAVPSAVLEAHQDELIPDKPTLGAFPTPDRLTAPSIEAWLLEDPRRLRGVLLESCRFSKDDRLVVQAVLQLAENVGIDLKLARDVVSHALMDARRCEEVAR